MVFYLVHQHVVIGAVPEVKDYRVAIVYYATETQDLTDVVGKLEVGDRAG